VMVRFAVATIGRRRTLRRSWTGLGSPHKQKGRARRPALSDPNDARDGNELSVYFTNNISR
jgi:hypothetical protein